MQLNFSRNLDFNCNSLSLLKMTQKRSQSSILKLSGLGLYCSHHLG